MTTTSLPRLPKPMTHGGASVAIRLPIEPGAVGHKPTWRRVNPDSQFDLSCDVYAACAPDDDPCIEISAGWADHRGIQACTEAACFPDAEPR